MRTVSKFLSRFSLKTQIALVGGVGLAGIAMLVGLIVVAFGMREDLAAELQRIDETSIAMAELNEDALQMRRHEKDFLLRRDMKHATALEGEIKKTQTALAKLGNSPVTADYKADIGEIVTQIGVYQAASVDMVALQRDIGLTERDGLQGKFRALVQGMEAEAAKADLDKLTISVLQLRRHEKDFLMREEQRYVDQIKAEVTKAQALIDASSLDPDRKKALKATLASYQGDFTDLAGKIGALAAATKQLSAAFAKVDPILEKVGAAMGEKAARTRTVINDRVALLTRIIYATSAAVALLCAAFIFVVATGISGPLLGLTGVMKRLADKDWSAEIPALDRGDEIGRMAAAVAIFKDGGIENERLQRDAEAARKHQEEQEIEKRRLADEAAAETERKLKELEERMLRAAEEQKAAEEKMRIESERKRKAEMNALADGFESTVKGVVETVSSSASEMQSSSTAMSATAEETSRQATAVAAASEQASANVQTVASAAEELSSSIGEISRQVSESARMAQDAVVQAQATGQIVDGLSVAAQKIGDVVKLITDIASQTNLLALNATIEAARAGEAGKGFAVVASEVKSLATQTAKATDEIASQIQSVQSATQESVSAIQSIGKKIEQVNSIAASIASAVEEQGAATKEISRNVQQAAQGTQEVNKNIVSVTQASGEVGAAASQMNGASSELAKQAETLRLEVDNFISRVRAG